MWSCFHFPTSIQSQEVMGSLPLSSLASFFTTRPSLFGKPPAHSPHPKTRTHHHKMVSCNSQDEETPRGKFDRRNLLMGMGLGGMYGAAHLDSSALAAPITGPDLSKCGTAIDLNTNTPFDFNCCPPLTSDPEIVDFQFPPKGEPVWIRPAAHLVNEEYVQKYERAVGLMKALPRDDPRSFYQQANVHCAYCNLAYEQTGDPEMKLQVHHCWLFYPWHRWYLYFYERILGELIGDPNFSLPFWNWDNLPPAPYIPEMYLNKDSPLYDSFRNDSHLTSLVDLKSPNSYSTTPGTIISGNMTEMYTEMVRTKTLEDFYGKIYIVGTKPSPGQGTVERGSHDAVHIWVGQNTKQGFDLGNFGTASRDSLFCAHHANIDRLWTVWRNLPHNGPRTITSSEWLNANFLFYNEKKQLVRVYVKDTLDQAKMGYQYQKVDNPWLLKPKPYHKKSYVSSKQNRALEKINFPVKLDKVIKILVERPKKKRSDEEKEKEEELLVIEGIEADMSYAVRFEVYLNDVDDNPEELIDKAEYLGCYSQVPHKTSKTTFKSMIRLGLTEVLEDLEIEDDDKILVSIVPRAEGERITIGGINIVYVDYTKDI
ncbi:hypothetical protein ACS0TY_022668 [Phlomoides rotata]